MLAMEALTAELSAAAAELQEQAARVDQEYREASEDLQQLQRDNAALQSTSTEVSGDAAAAELQLRSLRGSIEAARVRQDEARNSLRPVALEQYMVDQQATAARHQTAATHRLTDQRREQVEEWQQQRVQEGRERVQADKVLQQRRAVASLQRRRSFLGSPTRLAACISTLTARLKEYKARLEQVKRAVAQFPEHEPETEEEEQRKRDVYQELCALDHKMKRQSSEMMELQREIIAEKELLGMAATGLEGDTEENIKMHEEQAIALDASAEDAVASAEDDIIDVDTVCVATESCSLGSASASAHMLSPGCPTVTASAASTDTRCAGVAEVTVRARLSADQLRRGRLSRQVEELEEQVMQAKRTLETQH